MFFFFMSVVAAEVSPLMMQNCYPAVLETILEIELNQDLDHHDQIKANIIHAADLGNYYYYLFSNINHILPTN